jgi:hypothetical protein
MESRMVNSRTGGNGAKFAPQKAGCPGGRSHVACGRWAKTGRQQIMARMQPQVADGRQSVRQGGAGEKKFIPFEAGMCMKTLETRTLCPGKVGHLRRFDRLFAEICGFLWTILPEQRLRKVFLAQICGDRWSSG